MHIFKFISGERILTSLHSRQLKAIAAKALSLALALGLGAGTAQMASAGAFSANDDAMAIGEMALYQLVYSQTKMPAAGSVNGVVTGGNGWYETDNSAAWTNATSYSRTAVYLELETSDNTSEWALVTLPQYTTDITRMDFAPPSEDINQAIHSALTGADFYISASTNKLTSFIAAGATQDASHNFYSLANKTALVELWGSNYGSSGGTLYGSNDGQYDWWDTPSSGGTHGSFQFGFYDPQTSKGQCFLSINNLYSTGNLSMGIGNQASSNPDFTFNPDVKNYSVRSVQMFVLPTAGVADTFVWKNVSGNWKNTTWLAGDLTTLQTTAPGSTNDAFVIGGNVSVDAAVSIQNLTISGTGNVTVSGESSSSGNATLAVSGTLDVQTNAILTFIKGSDSRYNSIASNTKLTGAGTILSKSGNSTINSTQTDDFTGTIRLQSGQLWVCGSTLKNATISLEGGDLRNNGNNASGNIEIASNIVINAIGGGIHPGWTNRIFTLSGIISNGTADTLKIVRDSNDSNWTVLTNPNNSFSKLETQNDSGGYTSKVRVTNIGALGDISGSVINGGVLDLFGCSNSADGGTTIKQITGSGIVTNNKSNTTSTVFLTANSSLSFVDAWNQNASESSTNARVGVSAKSASSTTALYLTGTKSNYSGGLTVTQGIVGSAFGSAFGTEQITLENNTTLFNNNYSVQVGADILLKGASGSLRTGWESNGTVLHASGDITGTGLLNLHYGEAGPGILMFSGNNTYSGGTKFNSVHSRIIVNTNSAFGNGTFNTSDANTQLDFNTGGTWGGTTFNTLTQSDWGINSFNFDLNGGQKMVNVGANSFVTEVTAAKDGSLTFGRANSAANIFVTDLATGTRTQLFATDATDASFTFTAGKSYRIDARYDASNLVGNFTVKEAEGSAQPLVINQDGSWKNIATITSSVKNWTVATPFNIGTKTLTLTNPGIGSATFSGTIDGSGTIVLNGVRNGAQGGVMVFNGTPLAEEDKFNVSVAANTRFTGNGIVGGSLTLGDNTAFLLSKDSGNIKVNGDLTLQGVTEFVIDLSGISESTDWGDLLGNSSTLTKDHLKFTFTGDASGIDSQINLTVFDQDFSNQITTAELAKLLDFSDIASTLNVLPLMTSEGLVFAIGTHSALPEPATWLLLSLTLPGLFLIRRKMK